MDIRDLTLAVQDVQSHLTGKQRWLPVQDLERALLNAMWSIQEWQKEWKATRKDPVSKWDLMSDADRAFAETEHLRPQVGCMSCGWLMNTEAQFARHYVITDLQYPNLGSCWTRVCPEYVGTRPEWTMDHMPPPDDAA